MISQKSKTDKIFKAIEKQGFHPKDITYTDGYFIFDHGKDMVVHFHIKECKGWLFGIWWDLEDKNKFTFFTQFEDTIDKFKPSASQFVVEEIYFGKDIDDNVKFYLGKMLNFIKNHKYRAWYYDNSYAHNLWDYISGFEAWKRYMKYKFEEKKRLRIKERANKRWSKLVKEICEEILPDYEIIDENQNGLKCYPRFQVVCDGDGEGGSYLVDLESELDEKLFKKTVKFDDWMKKTGRYLFEVNPFDGRLHYWVRKAKNDKSGN